MKQNPNLFVAFGLLTLFLVASPHVALANGVEKAASAAKASAVAPADASASSDKGSDGFDSSAWNSLLQKYVKGKGFRYAALHANAADRQTLRAFLSTVANADTSGWSRNEKLAFYINAYNAYTVGSVIELWPISSVMKIKGPDFFKGRKHRVAGRSLSLDQLENSVIRKRFREARIHFAVNCASKSCPPLARRAYTAKGLSGQLERQTKAYIRSAVKVDSSKKIARLSKIFEWFASDFDSSGSKDGVGVRSFVAKRLRPEEAAVLRDPSTKVVFDEYSWQLNKQ